MKELLEKLWNMPADQLIDNVNHSMNQVVLVYFAIGVAIVIFFVSRRFFRK